jgi:hypothetical protein
MSDLNYAVQLIRQGQKEEARRILEALIKTEPGNIPAWFWYVETCPTVEKRIQVLEVCLKMNPGNAQAMQALNALRSQQQPAPAAFSASPVQPSQAPSFYSSTAYNDEPKPSTPVVTVAAQPQSVKQKNVWEQDNAAYVDTSMLSKPKPAARSYSFYDAWMTVLLNQDIESYAEVLDDPEAGAPRAFEWMAYAGIASGLTFPLAIFLNPRFSALMNTPEFSSLFGSMNLTALMVMMTVGMVLFVPIVSVLGLAINAAIQNLLAIFFGGRGYYGRTVYALAAYMAPVTILGAILGIIPVVGQCLASLLGIYNIILNVRALRASHSISTGSAVAVLFAPSIIVVVLGCVLTLLIGMSGGPR